MPARPISFSAESINKILQGKKTQTRRVINVRNLTSYRGHVYGFPGDELWVKEAWRLVENDKENSIVQYQAPIPETDWELYSPWKPARFMPRWASRLRLLILAIRQEKLQKISIEDAEAEGFECGNQQYADVYPFMIAWDKLNAKRGFPWASNPLVWVITFRVLYERKTTP